MKRDPILRFRNRFSSISLDYSQNLHVQRKKRKMIQNYKYLVIKPVLSIVFLCFGFFACESSKLEKKIIDEPEVGITHSLFKPVDAGEVLQENKINLIVDAELIDQGLLDKGVEKEKKRTLTKKKKKKKKCRRGIHKGRKKCKIERGHISIYHINRAKRVRNLKLIDDKRRIIPEAREVMLELLGDWREKKQCKKGFSFNYDYLGRASWRMYRCYVQDRLLWYLYLVGHHFDSEIQIVSGLRAKERKSSRHHNGHAVDFKVAGVKAKEVWEYCKRTFPLVGIGYYPSTRFVHLDVGRDNHQAYWVDSSGSGESALYKKGVSQIQKGRAKKSQAGMIKAIKRNLTRHFKSFKAKQKNYLVRKKKAEERKKRRKRKKRNRRKKN